MGEKYFIQETSTGYVIYQEGRSLPLPFLWITRLWAEEAYYKFTKGGYKEVAKYYYIHTVAGTRDISRMVKDGINPYEEWMSKNADMYKPTGCLT